MFGYISKREHDAVVARQEAISDRLHAELWTADQTITDLRARLSAFTAPRQRDERDRFPSGRG